jgi:membrane-associated phospholipid phosphatase
MATMIAFFSTRPRFFYYLAVAAICTLMISYMKIAYHEPRPYMISPDITPISCSKAFGQPSGHSMAASLLAIAGVLDVFHGVGTKRFYSNGTYFFVFSFALYWAITIPYTRFLLGVHSLDQIVYGSTLGVWAGFTMHFLVRDHLMNNVEEMIEDIQ